MIDYVSDITHNTLGGITMLGIQQYALTILKIDVNNALIVAQNDDVGNATQCL